MQEDVFMTNTLLPDFPGTLTKLFKRSHLIHQKFYCTVTVF